MTDTDFTFGLRYYARASDYIRSDSEHGIESRMGCSPTAVPAGDVKGIQMKTNESSRAGSARVRTGTAVFAVAILCLAAVGLFCIEDASAEGTSADPTFKNSVLYCSHSHTVSSDGSKMTITLTANKSATTNYAVPTDKADFTVRNNGTATTSFEYEYTEDRSKATIVVLNPSGEVEVRGACVQILGAVLESEDGKSVSQELPDAYKGE